MNKTANQSIRETPPQKQVLEKELMHERIHTSHDTICATANVHYFVELLNQIVIYTFLLVEKYFNALSYSMLHYTLQYKGEKKKTRKM
jgi:hypothetical protein